MTTSWSSLSILVIYIYIQLWPFISYNWLFQWDYTFYKWGDFLVLITGITRAITVYTQTSIGSSFCDPHSR